MRKYLLELIAAAGALYFLLTGRVSPVQARRAIDTDLLFLLFALLITVELLRESGLLERLVRAAATSFTTSRSLALALVLLSGGLSCLLTNDVALFVVIPFTVAASRVAEIPSGRVVILEIVAANLLGCLTPLGNPQNLFLFERSGWSAGRFMLVMLPFVAWSACGIIAATVYGVRPEPIRPLGSAPGYRWNPAAAAGVVCFALILSSIARIGSAWLAAVAAAVAGVAILRRRLLRVDVSIVALFLFAFVIVEGLRSFGMRPAADIYTSAIVLSQFISNVPAAILLSPFAASDWRELLYGVSAGGCGTIIASLANLLGWRLYVRESNGEPSFFRRLTMTNFAFLAWAALGGALLLRL